MTRLLAAALLLLSSAADAADFNDFVPGARANGMGGAFSAIADDPWGPFFNPAGLANAPYAQLGTAVGRMQSPVGTMSYGSFSYSRPFEPVPTATVGAAYYAGRQTDGGDKDVFLFNFAQETKPRWLPLSRPLRVGGNFKFVNIDRREPGAFGMGGDGGVLLRSIHGYTASFVGRDFTTNTGVPRPIWTLGGTYTWKRWLTLAGDLRMRKGLTEFYPGVEATFLNGLLKGRAGRGFQLDGVRQLALGMGVNFSPLLIDVAMTFPTGGPHRKGGHYQASLTYRFGAPSFAGNFIGQAASAAEGLRSEIGQLEERKKTAASDARAQETNRDVAGNELKVIQSRVKEANEELRKLRKRRDELDYEIQGLATEKKNLEPKPLPPPPKKVVPRAVWPKRHTVKGGDTLRGIAAQYYGDAARWEPIYDANRDKVDRGLPREGESLTIPEPDPTWRR